DTGLVGGILGRRPVGPLTPATRRVREILARSTGWPSGMSRYGVSVGQQRGVPLARRSRRGRPAHLVPREAPVDRGCCPRSVVSHADENGTRSATPRNRSSSTGSPRRRRVPRPPVGRSVGPPG